MLHEPHLKIVDHDLAEIICQANGIVQDCHASCLSEMLGHPTQNITAVLRVKVDEHAFCEEEGRDSGVKHFEQSRCQILVKFPEVPRN